MRERSMLVRFNILFFPGTQQILGIQQMFVKWINKRTEN